MEPGDLALSPTERALYETVVLHGRVKMSRVAELTGLDPHDVRESLQALESLGLLARSPAGDPLEYSTLDPALAVEALLRRREAEIADAQARIARTRKWASQLTQHYLTSREGSGAKETFEVIESADAARTLIEQLQRSSRIEVCILEKNWPGRGTLFSNDLEKQLLHSKVTSYRVIYERAAFDIAGKLDEIRACVAAGEAARVLSDVPIQLTIVDHRRALARMRSPDRSAPRALPYPPYLLIHESHLLDAFHQLYEALWTRATPIATTRDAKGIDSGSRSQLDELDDRILMLLAAGVKDESIGRELKLAPRTVGRRIARLMDQLDASTRFQTGLKAAKRGWL